MSFESEINASVQRMFSHAKAVVNRNLQTAVKEGKITLEQNKIPGLSLLISQSLDEALRSGSRDLNSTLAENAQLRHEKEKEEKSKKIQKKRE